jgi:hypothetical protein
MSGRDLHESTLLDKAGVSARGEEGEVACT